MSPAGTLDPFQFQTAEQWVGRFHRLELRWRSRPWTKPLAFFAWIGFMTSVVLSSPALRKRTALVVLGRFWIWQIWRRTVKVPILIKTGYGHHLSIPPWSKLGGMTIALGTHEPREEIFLSHYVRPGDVILDVGANIGVYTCIAAHLGAHVYAFEPSSKARCALQSNVALLAGCTVDIVADALGEDRRTLRLTTTLDVTNHLVESGTDATTEVVEVMSLDDLVQGESPKVVGPITLIKIDAEGFDYKVLKGGEGTILRYKPVVIVETWGDQVVREWLEERGFSVYLYSFETRELLEYPRPWPRQANFIAIHRDSLSSVRDRLAAAAGQTLMPLPRIIWKSSSRNT